jgi:peptidase C39-like protein
VKRPLLRVAGVLLALAAGAGGVLPAYAWNGTVPVFTQRSPLWAREPLGSDLVDTIGSSGCALTAASMVQAAFGYQTNPHLLNRWLTQHGGYVENDAILWRTAMGPTAGMVRLKWVHIPGIVPQLRTDDQDSNDRPDAAVIRQELAAGNLVVVEVRLYGNMHFVVLTAPVGADFAINDPWYGDRTTLSRRYGPYQTAVYSARIYYRAPASS